MPISLTTGPFTTTIPAKDDVELNIEVSPLDCEIRIVETGEPF
jgi:hypothetical protein